MILILRKGYETEDKLSHIYLTSFQVATLNLCCFFFSPHSSVEQKRKGLKGAVDLEKIRCVETVQADPNAPQERMYAFQVDLFPQRNLSK